jgi:hypothetical protein
MNYTSIPLKRWQIAGENKEKVDRPNKGGYTKEYEQSRHIYKRRTYENRKGNKDLIIRLPALLEVSMNE